MALPPDAVDSAPPGPDRPALPFILSGVMLVIYFSFIVLVGYHQPAMGREITPGLSWGILLGALVIVSAWLLTLIYVMSINRKGGA